MCLRSTAFLKIVFLLPAVLLSASCGTLSGLRKPEPGIPVVRVARKPVEVQIHTIGELRPVQTAMIVAPPAGAMLQIVDIVKTGTPVKAGDVVVSFDPSEQEYNLEQSRSQLEEAEQQLTKMKADQAVRVAQERVSLLRAQSAVRRAELKVKGNDLLSGIEAKKNLMDLEEAKRRLQQVQRDIQSRASSDAADLAVQNVARTKAMLGIKMAQQFIDTMTCRAPINGIVVLGQNPEALMSASGGITITSDTEIPEFRQGDQTYSGRPIAQIQDVGKTEIAAKVIETDRGSLEPGQPVDVVVDSKPLKTYKGKIKTLAEQASNTDDQFNVMDYLEALSTRSFAAVFEVDPQGDSLNLGVSARVTIAGKHVGEVLSLPRQALHQKEGKPVVYLRGKNGWEAREVRVKFLTEGRAVIEGLAEGTEVALVNPERLPNKTAGKTGTLTSILGAAK